MLQKSENRAGVGELVGGLAYLSLCTDNSDSSVSIKSRGLVDEEY